MEVKVGIILPSPEIIEPITPPTYARYIDDDEDYYVDNDGNYYRDNG